MWLDFDVGSGKNMSPPSVSNGLDTVLPLLGVAGSVGHEVVVNVEAAVLGCEEPHVGHGLLHLIYYVQMLNQAI